MQDREPGSTESPSSAVLSLMVPGDNSTVAQEWAALPKGTKSCLLLPFWFSQSSVTLLLQVLICVHQLKRCDSWAPQLMSTIKWSFLSSDCVTTGCSGGGSCCLGMNPEGGLSLGSFLVPASFLAGSRSELRCFRRQTKAEYPTQVWRL